MELNLFNYSGQEVRTTLVDGQPWFIAGDICDYFGVTNRNRAMQVVDEEDKGGTQIDTPGGRQTATIINESGLYALLFSLQPQKARGLSEAEVQRKYDSIRAFKRWVTHEVLPAIRKTGSYSAKELSRLELIDMARDSELGRMQELEARQAAESKVLELEGPATAWNTLASAQGDLDVRDAAQVLCRDHSINIGRNRLFDWLRAHKWIDGTNRPYQNRVDQGLIREKVSTFKIQRTAGEMLAPPQVRITAKGLQRLHMELGADA